MDTLNPVPIPGETPHLPHTRLKKRGRPFKKPHERTREVDKAAEQLADKHELPEVPGKQLKFEQVIDYLKLLTPEMWTHVAVYVYRLKPRIIRQLKDPQAANYIDVISEPFTIEYFINTHGGGVYLLQVTDTEKKRPESQLFRCIFDIDINQYEPKINYEELDINHRENMAYVQLLQTKGILNDKGHVVPPSNPSTQSTTGAGVNTEVIKEILGFVSKLNTEQQAHYARKLTTDEDPLNKAIGQILVERMKQDDPSKPLEVVDKVLSHVKEFAGGNKGDIGITQILQMQSEQRKIDLEYTKLVLETRKDNTDTNSHNQLAQFKEFCTFARDFMGNGGGGSHRSAWDIGLDYVHELGVPLLQTVNNLVSGQRGGPTSPITAPAGGGAGAFDPYANPGEARAYANRLNAQGRPGAPGAAPGMAGVTPGNELMAVFQQSVPLIVNALNSGTRGFDFADYLVGLMGTATHAMISAQGEQNMVTTAMAIPDLALFGEARLRTFAQEFINYETHLEAAAAAAEKAE